MFLEWRVSLDNKDDFIFSFVPKEKNLLKKNKLKEITIYKNGKNQKAKMSPKR